MRTASALVVFGFALATARSASVNPTAAQAPANPNDSDYWAAKRWLTLVEGGDASTFQTLTAVPFQFAVSAGPSKCQGRSASADEIGAWLACMRVHHKPLISVLMDEAMFHPAAVRQPKGLTDLMKRIDETGDWLAMAVKGWEGSYEMRFLLTKGADGQRRVSAFVYDAQVIKRGKRPKPTSP